MPRERSVAELKREPLPSARKQFYFPSPARYSIFMGMGRPNKVSWRMAPDIATETKFRHVQASITSLASLENATNTYTIPFFYLLDL